MSYRALEDAEFALVAAALEATLDGMAILDAQGRIAHANDAFAATHGTEAAALIGEPWTALYPPDEQARLQRDVLPLLDAHGSWQGQAVTSDPDGRPLEQTLSMTRTDRGATVLIARRTHPDTGAPYTPEDRLRVAVDHAPLALYAIDPDGRFTFVEGKVLRTLGLTPDDIVGEPAAAFGDARHLEADLERLGRGERVRREASFGGRHFESILEPVLDEEGDLEQAIGIALDITERRTAQRELEATRELFEAVFHASNDPIFLHDTDGEIQEASREACTLLGYDHATLCSMHLKDLLPEADRELAGEQLDTVLSEGSSTFEATFVTADGDEVPVEISASRFQAGERTLIQGIARDVTDRHRTEANLRLLIEELETSEAELRSLVAALPDDVYVLDADGRYLESPGTDPTLLDVGEDPIGRRIDAVLPDAVGRQARAAIDEALAGQRLVQAEISFHRDERHVHHEVRFVPLPGELVMMLARDITDRRDAEAGLERAHQRLLTFIDHLDAGILVEDADRQILHANEGFLEAFAVDESRRELVGQPALEMMEDVIGLFDAPDRVLELLEGLPGEGVPARGRELELVDGRVVSVDYIPIDLDRLETAHLWRYLDITERSRAEAERRAAQEQFEVAVGDLARSLGGAEDTEEVARRLAHGTRVVTDAEATIVLTPDEILASHTAARLDVPEVNELVRSNPERFTWFEASLQATDTPVDLLVLPADGESLTDADARKVEILATQAAISFHRAEVTARIRRAHDRLERSARQKQMFLDILSHDLKNPLTVASGRIELLAMQHPEIADDLATVEDALDRADRLIDRSLLYSRLEEQQALDRQPRDLASLVEDAIDSLQEHASEASIELRLQRAEEALSPVHPVLVQAVENLISNAIKWSPPDATVELEVLAREADNRVRVVDHGPGIPPEDRDRLFERFSRVDRTGTKGTGLGLAIAKRVVEMHEGRIWHEPTPGGGATFLVQLPQIDA